MVSGAFSKKDTPCIVPFPKSVISKLVFSAIRRLGPCLDTAPAEKNPGNLSNKYRPMRNFAKIPNKMPIKMVNNA